MALIHLTDDTFEAEVLKAKGLVLVDFWADWCGPCHMIAPLIEEISEEKKDVVKVGKLNVDENRKFMMEYQILGIPTTILFKDGEVAERWTGVQPNIKKMIIEGIDNHK